MLRGVEREQTQRCNRVDRGAGFRGCQLLSGSGPRSDAAMKTDSVRASVDRVTLWSSFDIAGHHSPRMRTRARVALVRRRYLVRTEVAVLALPSPGRVRWVWRQRTWSAARRSVDQSTQIAAFMRRTTRIPVVRTSGTASGRKRCEPSGDRDLASLAARCRSITDDSSEPARVSVLGFERAQARAPERFGPAERAPGARQSHRLQ
jgi:hypothetical protein